MTKCPFADTAGARYSPKVRPTLAEVVYVPPIRRFVRPDAAAYDSSNFSVANSDADNSIPRVLNVAHNIAAFGSEK